MRIPEWPQSHVLFNREKPPCDTDSKNKIKSILRGDGATEIREIWITRSSWSLMDPISHTQARRLADKIRGIGAKSCGR